MALMLTSKAEQRFIVFVSLPNELVKWDSQRLVIQLVLNFWRLQAETLRASFISLEAHPDHLESIGSELRAADLIVFGWNGPVYLRSLRVEVGASGPAVIYLAGEGSRGFCNSIARSSFARNTDLFICVSEAEKKMLRLCFSSAKSILCPYPNLLAKNSTEPTHRGNYKSRTRLIYIGRYSEQKNLHNFLWALKIFIQRYPKLEIDVHFYGFEDKLSSPNMKMRGRGYEVYLKKLGQLFGLSTILHWHGFVKNSVLKNLVQADPHVYVSTSLYSEECFGLAPFDSLIRGNYAVLTAWGGFLDLKKNFKNRVKTAAVLKSNHGPYICPFELAGQIRNAVVAFQRKNKRFDRQFNSKYYLSVPRAYRAEMIHAAISEALQRVLVSKGVAKYLRKSKWLEDIERQIIQLNPNFKKAMKETKIHVYRGYEDPLAKLAFEHYGMNKSRGDLQGNLDKSSSLCIPPWVEINDSSIRVTDPHRGSYKLSRIKENLPVFGKLYNHKEVKLSIQEAKWLFERGYAFFSGEESECPKF